MKPSHTKLDSIAKPSPKVELLMPAGSLQKLKYAFAYGADAVYAGVPMFSLRARENSFSLDELREGVKLTRKLNKKIYITLNVFAKNRKLKNFSDYLDEVIAIKPDALIMGDPGLIDMALERTQDVPVHLSVQANCMNWRTAAFWKKVGISRIILSRELMLGEIQEIHKKVPGMELEAFVHGSICIAYSGRCLLSSYMSYRDANQGVCDNSCRYPMNVVKKPAKEDYFVEDLRNKGEYYQLDEDENGSYIMNAKDLRLIQHLEKIKNAGICSFKIEGRTKSIYYLSMVTRAYRKAIDAMESGQPFDSNLMTELEKIPHRGYDTGFIVRQEGHKSQNYDNTSTRGRGEDSPFVGLTQNLPRPSFVGREQNPSHLLPVEVRNKIGLGDEIEIISPTERCTSTIQGIYDKEGAPVDTAHGGTGVFFFETKAPAHPYGIVRKLNA